MMKKNKKYAIKVKEAFLVRRLNEEKQIKYMLSALVNYSDTYKDFEEALEIAEDCRKTQTFRNPIIVCEVVQVGNYYRIKDLKELEPIPIVPII